MEIVFVHLNSKIPKFMRNNILRTKSIAESKTVTLISNIPQRELPGIKFELIQESRESAELEFLLTHPKDFRGNFWHTSIARFAFLSHYQSSINEPIIHFESDVIIAKDFPFSEITRVCVDKIAYPILASRRGVGSAVYSPNSQRLKEMVEHFIVVATRDTETTDMLALRDFYNRYPEKTYVLPGGPDQLNAYHKEISEDLFPRLEKGIHDLRGVFDGTDIGFYFFGTNPNNTRGFSYFRKEIPETYTKMSNWEIVYNKERDFPDLVFEGSVYSIYNLHLTSKPTRFFTSNRLEKKLNVYLAGNRSINFRLDIFLTMLLRKLHKSITKGQEDTA